MSAIPVQSTAVSAVPRARTILYIRAVVALGMIGAWAAGAATGILVWLAADGRGAGQLQLLFGASKHSWMDIHVVISTLAVALTITHLTVMRRGVLAYARLLLTGQRSASARTPRRPRAIVFVRALVVVAMVSAIPVVVATGIVPWLAEDGRRSGQQLLLFAVTKRGWGDIHTAISVAVVTLAVTHLAVVRSGLAADLRLLATGQRSAPRHIAS